MRDRVLAQVGVGLAACLILASGILVNIIVDQPLATSGLAASVAAFGALISISLLAVAQRTQKREGQERQLLTSTEVALRRLSEFFSSARDRWLFEAPWLDLSISVRGGRRLDNLSSATFAELEENYFASGALIAQLADQPQVTFIVGSAGSGKTALLYQLGSKVIANQRAGKTSYIPLFAACHSWNPELEFETWVVDEARKTFGIPGRTVTSWVTKGSLLLMLDGMDEVDHSLRMSFVSSLNSWLDSPVAGKAIITCRNDAYLSFAQYVRHDKLAVLEPLRLESVRKYVKYLFQHSTVPPIRSGLEEISKMFYDDLWLADEWRTPRFVQLLAETATLPGNLPDNREKSSSDPTAAAVRLGDNLLLRGDTKGAIRTYQAALTLENSTWRSIAHVRLALLLADAGDIGGAHTALQGLLSDDIEDSLRAPHPSVNVELSPDEKEVLTALDVNVSLDEVQLASKAVLSSRRTSSALRCLRDRGLVEVIETPRGDRRFRRSPVDLPEAG